jgi:hypothetical protein
MPNTGPKDTTLTASPGVSPDDTQLVNPLGPANTPQNRGKHATASKHIPITALIAYKEQGLSNNEIGMIVGCTGNNVQQRLADEDYKGFKSFKDTPDLYLEQFCYRFISELTPAQIKSMADRRGMTDFGIAWDKMREYRGQSNSNIKPMVMIVKGTNVQINTQHPVDNPVHNPLLNNHKHTEPGIVHSQVVDVTE